MRTVIFAVALLVSAGAQGQPSVCTLSAECDPHRDCMTATASVSISEQGAKVALDGHRSLDLTRVGAGDVLDRVDLGGSEMEIRATADAMTFFADGLSGAIIRGDGDEIVLTVREIPRRYADYPGASRTWRGVCGGLF